MAQFSRIQRGSTVIPGNSTTVDVSILSVDPSKCMVFHSSRATVQIDSINYQLVAGVYHTFPNSTTLRLGRESNVDGTSEQIPINIEWQIVEFSSGVKVQRRESNFTDELGEGTINFTSAVDTNKSWVRVYETGSGPNWAFNGFDTCITKLNSNSFYVRNDRTETHTTSYFWEVVEYDNCTVQWLSATFPTGFGTTTQGLIGTLSTPVNPNKTLVISNRVVKNGVNFLHHQGAVLLSGTDKIVWRRNNSTDFTDTVEFSVYVIEFTDANVYQRTANMGTSATYTENVLSAGFDYNKSITFLNTTFNKIPDGGNHAIFPTSNYVTHKLTSEGLFSASKGSSDDVNVSYQIVEFGVTSASLLNGWNRRCKITIDKNNICSNLTDFPVLLTKDTVPSEMLTLGGQYTCKSDGSDIRISTDINGNIQCPVEVAYISLSADPNNSKLELYTKIPNITTTENTEFYIWYNNPTASAYSPSNTYGKYNVWDSNYVAVWHLNNEISAYDSTINNIVGSINGTTFQTSVNIMGAGSRLFNGTSDYISVPKKSGLYTLSDLTLEGWGYQNGAGEGDSWFLDFDYIGYRLWRGDFGNLDMFVIRDPVNGWSNLTNPTPISGSWNYLAGTYQDGSTDIQRLYINGVQTASATGIDKTFADTSAVQSLSIGAHTNTTNNWKGYIDEVRISKTPRSQCWILATNVNTKTPTSFLTTSIPESPSNVVNIITFSASPLIVCSGSSTVLNWNVSGIGNYTVKISEYDNNPIRLAQSAFNNTHVNETTSTYSNVTVTSGQNRMFIVLYGNEDATGFGRPISATYGSKTMSMAVSAGLSAGSSNAISIWYLPCETSGIGTSSSNTLTFVHNQLIDAGIVVVPLTFTECAQRAPYITHVTSGVNVSSLTNTFNNVNEGDLIIQVYENGDEARQFIPNSNQIEIADLSASSTRNGCCYFIAPSAGNYNLQVKDSADGSTNRIILAGAVFRKFDGILATSGTLTVTPSDTTEYILSAYNDEYHVYKSCVVVYVNYQADIDTFIATPSNIQNGGNSTLSWVVSNHSCWCTSGVNAGVTSSTTVTSAIQNTSAWSTFDREYRALIRIQTSALSGSSSNFPLYFDLRNLSADNTFWNNVTSDGGDLIVATSADVQLPLEVVWISAASKAGEIYFKATNELSAVNSYYLYWGKSGASQPNVTATYGRNAVWSNGYRRVWHFQNMTNGVASCVDSTGNVSALVPNISSTYMSDCPVQGQAFSATLNNFINAPGQFSDIMTSQLSAASTFEVITKHKSTYGSGGTAPERRHIISFGGAGADWAWFWDTNGTVWWEQAKAAGGWDVFATTKNSWAGGQWFQVVMTMNNKTGTYFIDGVQEKQTTNNNAWTSTGINYAIGNHGVGGPAQLDDTAHSELRISNVVRSSAWIKTQANMNANNRGFWTNNSSETRTTSAVIWTSSTSYSGTLTAWEIDRAFRTTISTTNLVKSSEIDFPLYYDLTNISANDFWNSVESNGGDLIITSSDGITQLPLEVVYVDKTNKKGEIYFKNNINSSAVGNTYYLYWGKSGASQPAASATYGKNNVWTKYYAVYHLKDLTESTGRASVLTNNGATEDTSGSGYVFNGTSSYLSFNGVSFTSIQAMTFENFILVDSTGTGLRTLVRARNAGAGIPATGPGIRDNPSQIEYHWADQANTYGYDPNKNVPENRWFFYGVRVGSSSGTFRVSGTDTTNAVTHNAITCTTAVEWRIGDDPTHNRFFKGKIGEVRLMSATASEGWTTTQENLFTNNSDFWQTSTQIENRYLNSSNVDFYDCNNSTFRIYYEGSTSLRTNRTTLTLNRTYLLSSMPYYPVSFLLENITTSAFWNNVKSDGGDLVITDTSGNRLPLDVDYLDKSNRRGLIHFSTSGVLSNATNPQYYLYWGGDEMQPSVSSTYGKYNVWDSNYVAVWHFGETGTGSVGYFKDSTRYQNNSTNTTNQPLNESDTLSANFVFGIPKVMNGNYLDIQVTSALQQISATNQVTTEVLFNRYYDQYGADFSHQFEGLNGSNNSLAWGDLINFEATDRINFAVGGLNDNIVSDDAHDLNSYYQKNAFGFGRYGSGSLTISAFVAGSVNTWGGETETGKTGTLLAPTLFTIGSRTDHSHPSKGWMYELRISKIARPDPWVATSRYMMLSGTSIWTVSGTTSGSYNIPEQSNSELVIVSTKSYSNDRKYRCKIILDRNQVFTNETGYPLTFNLERISGTTSASNLFIPFWNHVQSDGGDLLLTTVNGTRLPLQVDYIDKVNKKGTIHFKNTEALKTSIDSTDNEYYLYWGSVDGSILSQPASSATYGSQNVWDENYILVLHLSETSGTTVYDSTRYLNNGTSNGSVQSISSPIGRGFTITNPRNISIPSATEFNVSAYTIEFIVRTDYTGTQYPVFFIQERSSVIDRTFHATIYQGGFGFYGQNNDPAIVNTPNSNSTNEWFGYGAKAQQGSSASFIVNTSVIGTDPSVPSIGGANATIYIGDQYTSATFEIDEVRYSNKMRSDGWIKTTNNILINNPTVWRVETPEIVPINGSTTVSPTQNTTYTIEIINCCGTVSQSVTVSLNRIINTLRKVLKGTNKGILKGVM